MNGENQTESTVLPTDKAQNLLSFGPMGSIWSWADSTC